jgi:hypothetical protein
MLKKLIYLYFLLKNKIIRDQITSLVYKFGSNEGKQKGCIKKIN